MGTRVGGWAWAGGGREDGRRVTGQRRPACAPAQQVWKRGCAPVMMLLCLMAVSLLATLVAVRGCQLGRQGVCEQGAKRAVMALVPAGAH